MTLLTAAPLAAQQPARPFAVTDNSFLVEEAFNQEPGVFQNSLLVQHVHEDWSFEFTQEWPLGGMRHQLSYTVPLEATRRLTSDGYRVERGTFEVNYRLQVLEEGASRPAISPRMSLLVPLAPQTNGYGLNVNVPASKQFGNFYLHANAGYTHEGIGGSAASQSSVQAAGSVIYRLLPMVHLMAESVFSTNQYDSENSWVISPGVRAGVNFGAKQFVVGMGVPLGLLRGDPARALLIYTSYELPF